MVSDLPSHEEEGGGLDKKPLAESEAPEGQKAEMSYLRVIVQLVLILPCAVLIFPALIFGVIELANSFRSIERGPHYLTSAVTYGLGFVCVVSGIFLSDRFSWRWVGILIVVIGLPLFIDGALAMSDRLQIFGAGRQAYEILVIFTGPVVVTAWNVVRLWRGRSVEAV
ncbi:MAG TPA: hypothetical protein VK961_18940 [Chthoniobacter sp.]|nr:hypothetical protein [Chthoniobacter sp.]